MKSIYLIKYKKQYKKIVGYINWRFLLLYTLFGLLVMCLVIRITYLQIINPKDLVKKGDMRSLRIQKMNVTRGIICDREGRELAVSIPTYAILADPKIIHKNINFINNKRWKILSTELNIPLKKIYQKIIVNPNSRFIYLARQVNMSIGKYINKLKIPGIFLRNESRRYYPYGSVLAHVIGVTDIDGQGIEGIEKSFNSILTGIPGKKIVRKDRYGKVIEDISLINKQVGHNVTLSIDERIQSVVYRILRENVQKNKAESGTAILINIHTGEILAMVNNPSYNPNNLSDINFNVMRNRAITDVFEPGSTVKPMVIINALYKGLIKENTILNTQPYFINGHKIKDVSIYKKLSIADILKKSSNVGVSKLALSMPATELVDVYTKFGLGKSTNLGLIGEHSGFIPSEKKKWSKFERATFSFGYGLMVTPLQLARVYSIIGSFGIHRPLSIIKVNSPILGKRIFPDNIIRKVVNMMEKYNVSDINTKSSKYRMAIKTGTVKKVGNNGHYINQYIAYTAGIAPINDPRYSLTVIINNPTAGKYYGGTVSTPIFETIMNEILRLMNIEPDLLSSNYTNIFLNKK